MSNGNGLKKSSCPIHISQMYDYVFNEEEMKKKKKQGKEDEKRKSASFFRSPRENRM